MRHFLKTISVRLFIFGRESEILSENYGFLDCIKPYGPTALERESIIKYISRDLVYHRESTRHTSAHTPRTM